MKITGQQPPITKETQAGQVQSKETLVSSKKLDSVDAQKSVKTSSFATEKLKNRVNQEPEVRAEKVAELKAKIAKGEYKVDAHKLAEKMISESLKDRFS